MTSAPTTSQTPRADGPASLAILGTYPPPFGGVTTHLRRLCALLQQRGIKYINYNLGSGAGDGERIVSVYSRRRRWMLRYLLAAKEPAIYLLASRLDTWIYGALMASWRGKRVIVRLRNAALPQWIAQSWWRRALIKYSMSRMTAIVCVSRFLADTVQSLGIDPSRIIYAPGFLPPTFDPADRDEVSPRVWEFLEDRKPIIAANGKVGVWQGADLYALDHLVELAARLKPDYPDIGIVVCFWDHQPEDQPRLDALIQRARDLGVAGNIFFNTTLGVFVPVLMAADIFVRPTNTDGDANSVREALYLGIPTVASDVVERPEGAILFRTRDLDDFEEKVRGALQYAQTYKSERQARLAPEDRRRIDAYIDFLEAVSAGRSWATQQPGLSTP